MVLRLFVGESEGPLRITPSGGLGKTQVEFVNDKVVEIATGKRDSGLVSDLTNFDWDSVCLFLPGWLPPGGPSAPYPLYDPGFTGDPKFFHLVFGQGGIRNMTLRFKRTDQLDYDLSGQGKTGCLSNQTSFSSFKSKDGNRRFLRLN
jgi:hypothetical protein